MTGSAVLNVIVVSKVTLEQRLQGGEGSEQCMYLGDSDTGRGTFKCKGLEAEAVDQNGTQ